MSFFRVYFDSLILCRGRTCVARVKSFIICLIDIKVFVEIFYNNNKRRERNYCMLLSDLININLYQTLLIKLYNKFIMFILTN